jgi:hypothetical protein
MQKPPIDRETAWAMVQADLLSIQAYIMWFGIR